MPELDIPGLVTTLNRHGVRYVVIGGAAAMVRDLPIPATVDLDITPETSEANLSSLADAFEELEAGLLTAEETGTWFPRRPVENWAQYETLHLVTNKGLLDIVFAPDGAPAGYDDLITEAVDSEILDGATRAMVISTDTWERLKIATGRAKDLEQLDRFYNDK